MAFFRSSRIDLKEEKDCKSDLTSDNLLNKSFQNEKITSDFTLCGRSFFAERIQRRRLAKEKKK